MPRIPRIPLGRQAGVAAVQFALVLVIFLTFMFCIIEVARMVYLWNTLQEVTRRAANLAASADYSSVSTMNSVRQQAIFRDSAGELSVGTPVTDAHIRIDYMSLARAGNGSLTLTEIPNSSLPSCPAQNQLVCTANPNAANCIRFVRVRVCAPGSDASVCDPVDYVPLMPLLSAVSLSLPPSTTIVRAETLGYQPGQSLCP